MCRPLDAPENGNIVCDLGGDDAAHHGNSCNFTCNEGFMLRGNNRRVCLVLLGLAVWSGTTVTCEPGKD